jgi:adenylyltransferase/sulfurtransferase
VIVTPAELQRLLREGRALRLIDIRPELQREILPIEKLHPEVIPEERLELPAEVNGTVVLICQYGTNTEQLIKSRGWRGVYSLLGGVQAWNAYCAGRRDLSRYTRQMVLPEVGPAGQERLRAARVAVVGLGGLGCPVVQTLTAAGVGTLRLIDGDVVELSNLQRQPLYREADVGRPKARVVAERIRDLNHEVTFLVEEQYLSRENGERLLAGVDVIVDATDTLPARRVIDGVSRRRGVPLVYGGLYRYEGQVAVLNHRGGPGYRDLFPPGAGGGDTCAEGGVLGMLPGIIGNIQALEAVKLLLDLEPNLSGKLLLYDGLRHTTEIIDLG